MALVFRPNKTPPQEPYPASLRWLGDGHGLWTLEGPFPFEPAAASSGSLSVLG